MCTSYCYLSNVRVWNWLYPASALSPHPHDAWWRRSAMLPAGYIGPPVHVTSSLSPHVHHCNRFKQYAPDIPLRILEWLSMPHPQRKPSIHSYSRLPRWRRGEGYARLQHHQKEGLPTQRGKGVGDSHSPGVAPKPSRLKFSSGPLHQASCRVFGGRVPP